MAAMASEMAVCLHSIKYLSRHVCYTSSIVKSVHLGVRPIQPFVRYTQTATVSPRTAYGMKKYKLFTLGVASGVGTGISAFSIHGRRLKHHQVHASEISDPTSTESGWLPSTEAIYDKLIARVKSGELKLLLTTKKPIKGVLFVRSHPLKGAHFEYGLFFNEADQKAIAVIQFGPQTQGPTGYAHGGASAAIFDTVTANFMKRGLNKSCLTANLNINYKRPIPINSAVMADIWLEKTDGRKNLVHCVFKSSDGKVFLEGTSLWIQHKSLL